MKAFAVADETAVPALMDVPLPEPGEGEIRVRVRAASINGFDLAVAGGYLWGAMAHRFPVVLGKDFAGEVDSLGEGVEGFAVGDRVFGVVAKPDLGDGSLGEYVTVPTALGVAALPEGLDFTAAAGLGLAGTAAAQAVQAARIDAGQSVLVVGATGGVGQQAVQLATLAGAEVVATASSSDAAELVTRLGASRTVDHHDDLVSGVRALFPEGVDTVLHFAGDPRPLVAVVKKGGSFVSTMLTSASDLPADGIEVVSIYAVPTRTTLEGLARDQVDERTTVTVQRVYAFDDAAQAFQDFAAGSRGKLIITVA